jgi:hypothetical protein
MRIHASRWHPLLSSHTARINVGVRIRKCGASYKYACTAFQSANETVALLRMRIQQRRGHHQQSVRPVRENGVDHRVV